MQIQYESKFLEGSSSENQKKERIYEKNGFTCKLWREKVRKWQMVRVKTETAMRYDKVNTVN